MDPAEIKPPPSPGVAAKPARRPTPPEGEDPGVKKTKLWVDLLQKILVPLVTAGVTFLGTTFYSDAGQNRVKKQTESGYKTQRETTNATAEEITQLRAEMTAMAEAIKTLTAKPASTLPARGRRAAPPTPAPVKKAQAAAVQSLDAIKDRIADAAPIPLAPAVIPAHPPAATDPPKAQ